MMEALQYHPETTFVVTGSHDLLFPCYAPYALGNRYRLFTLYPFSFAEYLSYWCVPVRKLFLLLTRLQQEEGRERERETEREREKAGEEESEEERALKVYIVNGGFPGVFTSQTPAKAAKVILEGVIHTGSLSKNSEKELVESAHTELEKLGQLPEPQPTEQGWTRIPDYLQKGNHFSSFW